MRFLAITALTVLSGCGTTTTAPTAALTIAAPTNKLRSDPSDDKTTNAPTTPPMVDESTVKYFNQLAKVFFARMAGEDLTDLAAHSDLVSYKPSMTQDEFIESGIKAVTEAMSDRSNYPAKADALFEQYKNPSPMVMTTLNNYLKVQYMRLTKA